MVLTEWRKPTPEMQEYLKRRMLSIMLCVSWVCAGTLDDHEWLSESTIAEQEVVVMSRELDFEICFPCMVQWSIMWFSAPTRINQTLEGEEIKIAKYHEVVNMAITEAISMSFGWQVDLCSCLVSMVVTKKFLMNDAFWNP